MGDTDNIECSENFNLKPEKVNNEIKIVLKNKPNPDFTSVESDFSKEGQPISLLAKRSYSRMDTSFQHYLDIFNKYTEKAEKQKIIFKSIFFAIVMITLLFIIVSPYILLFNHNNLITDTTIISMSITSSIETVSAIIVLPKIIAKYLFNKDEDANKTNIIKGMQDYNISKKDNFTQNKEN